METLASQPISDEELLELAGQLDKAKASPEQALKLLKVLDRKKISAEQLNTTMIGKRLTAVKETDIVDSELLTQITEMKEYLKNKWRAIFRAAKEKKVEVKVAAPAATKFKLPYIPSDMRG